MSNVKFSGDGIGENKVVFDKLLAKWNEIFTRQSLAQEIESVKTCDETSLPSGFVDYAKIFSARSFSIQGKIQLNEPPRTKCVSIYRFASWDKESRLREFSLFYNNTNGKSLAFSLQKHKAVSNSSKIELSTGENGATAFQASVHTKSKLSIEDLFKELGQPQFFENMAKFVSSLEEREKNIVNAEKARKYAAFKAEIARRFAEKARTNAALSSALDNALDDL